MRVGAVLMFRATVVPRAPETEPQRMNRIPGSSALLHVKFPMVVSAGTPSPPLPVEEHVLGCFRARNHVPDTWGRDRPNNAQTTPSEQFHHGYRRSAEG